MRGNLEAERDAKDRKESGADLYLSRISAPTVDIAAAAAAADNVLKPRPQQYPNSHDKLKVKDKDKNKNKNHKTHETKKNPPPASSNKQLIQSDPATVRQPSRLPPKPKGQRSKRSKPLPPIPTPAIKRSESDAQRETIDRRRAVLRALEVIGSSSKVFEPKHGPAAAARKGMGVQMR